MSNKNKAVINVTLAAGSTTSPYFAQVNLTKRLCLKTCKNETPVFAPAFSVVGFTNVGTSQYVVTLHVEGTVTYNPCGTCGCDAKVERISQNFEVPLFSSTAPTAITIAQGATVNAMIPVGCKNCTRNFQSNTPLTITVA